MDQNTFGGFRTVFKSSKKLNTQEFCFFCLQTAVKKEGISDCQEERNYNATIPVPLGSLQHNLKIKLDNFLTNNESGLQGRDIEASLCTVCKSLVKKYSFLVQQLEKVQMEMDFYRERIKLRISQAAKDPELLQSYSKKMTSNPETLVQLAFIDKLRKEFSVKASQRLTRQLIVELMRTEVSVSAIRSVKTEPFEECEMASEDLPSPASSRDTKPCRLQSRRKAGSNSPAAIENPALEINRKSVFYLKNSQTGIYKCKKCGKEYSNARSCRMHYKTVHLKQRYKCDLCKSAIYPHKNNLIKHKRLCQQRLEKRLSNEKNPAFCFTCEFCKRRFDSKERLYNHRFGAHLTAHRFSCDLCDKKFKQNIALKRHKDSAHLGKTFSCRFCNNSYKWLTDTRKHEKKCKLQQKIKSELNE